jgi:serine/threonine protein kinase
MLFVQSVLCLGYSEDPSVPKYAALKIMTAGSSTASVELTILDHLSKAGSEDSASQHVTRLLDSFKHEGPNGIHQCLVLETMGASAASLVEELPENNPKLWDVPQRYPVPMAKKILIHALRALAFLHRNDVVHGDVQPGNLLFSVDNLDEVEQHELEQNEAKTAIPVQRLDGQTDKWAPRNLYKRQSLHDRVKLDSKLCVKLSDFGAGKFPGLSPRLHG